MRFVNFINLNQRLHLWRQLAGLDELERSGVHAVPAPIRLPCVSLCAPKPLSNPPPHPPLAQQEIGLTTAAKHIGTNHKPMVQSAHLLPVGRGPSLNTWPAPANH